MGIALPPNDAPRGGFVRVLNVHERELSGSFREVGGLIDSLSSRQDALWPTQLWPPMKFDRPLAVGAAGGHGPVRYFVETYVPGQIIRFRFTGPKGFQGHHRYEVVSLDARRCVLRHTLEMNTAGPAMVSWPVVFRPLHDALIEDSLAAAQAALGETPVVRRWSFWVRVLRWVLSRGRARAQVVPGKSMREER